MTMDPAAVSNSDNPPYRYNCRLLIKHPTEQGTRITSELGQEPDHFKQAGEPRRTPIGTPLPGNYRETTWSYSEPIIEDRLFFEVIVEMLAILEGAEEYIRGLIASGGSVSLIADLPGRKNIGDLLSAADLIRMGRLGVELGVEVFPHWN